MQSIPVRKLFWEAFELALETQTHRLAKDVCAALGQPEAPLLKALRDAKVHAHLVDFAADQDTDLEDHRCQELLPATERTPFVRPCGAPVVWTPEGPARLCLTHSLQPPGVAPSDLAHLPTITRMSCDDGTTLWVDTAAGYVYSEAGALVGRWLNGSLRLFEVLDPSEPATDA